MKIDLESRMLLSIVIPYFNNSSYIYACVESLLRACFFLSLNKSSLRGKDVFDTCEIIIVNDASDKYHTERLNSIYQRCWRQGTIIPVSIESFQINKGLSDARNHGISCAKGEYVFTLDADDFVRAESFVRVFEKLLGLDADMIFFDSYWYSGTDYSRMSKFNFEANAEITVTQKVLADYIRDGSFYAWRFFVRRHLLLGLPFPSRLYLEDIATTTPLLSHSKLIWYEPEPVVFYRQNPSSIMKKWTLQKSLDFIEASALLRERLYLRESITPRLNEELLRFTFQVMLWAQTDIIRYKVPNTVESCKMVNHFFAQRIKKMGLSDWLFIIRKLRFGKFKKLFIQYYFPAWSVFLFKFKQFRFYRAFRNRK